MAASVATLAADHAGHAQLLAASEIIGALLFLWRRSEIAGAGILLLLFATAETFSALKGQWATHFLQYAASVIFIVISSRSLRSNTNAARSSTTEYN